MILCSKQQRCSLQMSAAFSGAQIKKKVPRSVGKKRRCWGVGEAGSRCTFCLILKRSSYPTVLRCRSLCVVFFFTTPPTHTSLALLRWPRNVLCVRLTVCQSTCVLRWRKEMMMMMIHRVLCHPLFKLLSIPAGGAC